MKLRVSKACDNCNRKRKKCSGLKPCESCEKRSLPCTYNNPSKKRGPASNKNLTEDNSFKDIPSQTTIAASQDYLEVPVADSPASSTSSRNRTLKVLEAPEVEVVYNFQEWDGTSFPQLETDEGPRGWQDVYFQHINPKLPIFSPKNFKSSEYPMLLLHAMYLMAHCAPNLKFDNDYVCKHYMYCKILQENSVENPSSAKIIGIFLITLFGAINFPNNASLIANIRLITRYTQQLSAESAYISEWGIRDRATLNRGMFDQTWRNFNVMLHDIDFVLSVYNESPLILKNKIETELNQYSDSKIEEFHRKLLNIVKKHSDCFTHAPLNFKARSELNTALKEWRLHLPDETFPLKSSISRDDSNHKFMSGYVVALYYFCILANNNCTIFHQLRNGISSSSEITLCAKATQELALTLDYLLSLIAGCNLVFPTLYIFSYYCGATAAVLSREPEFQHLRGVLKKQFQFTRKSSILEESDRIILKKWFEEGDDILESVITTFSCLELCNE